MIVVPAIDILEDRAVQLRGGDPSDLLWEGGVPAEEATRWWDAGAERLHVVDLTRVLGRGSSSGLIRDVLAQARGPVAVGGGLRTTADLEEVLDRRDDATVVVATRAWREPDWLDHITIQWPGRVVVALELKGGRIAVRGWTQRLTLTLDEGLHRLAGLDLAGVLFTDVDREGQLIGPNIGSAARAVDDLDVPLIVSGGIKTVEHIREARDAGAHAVVVGTALYNGDLDLKQAQEAAR